MSSLTFLLSATILLGHLDSVPAKHYVVNSKVGEASAPERAKLFLIETEGKQKKTKLNNRAKGQDYAICFLWQCRFGLFGKKTEFNLTETTTPQSSSFIKPAENKKNREGVVIYSHIAIKPQVSFDTLQIM